MSIYAAVYLLIINPIGFFICAWDKRAAIKGRRRVSEKALFSVAFCGGAAGVYLAMLIFKHKTRHWYFMFFMPVIIAAQAALTVFLDV